MSDERADIIETTVRMAWLADRRDWDALVAVFTDEVEVDYSALTGVAATTTGRDNLVAGWRAGLAGLTATQHLLGNHLVTIDGDLAEVTAAFLATHLLANATGGPLWTLAGHYRYRVVRTPAGWRIAAVTMTPDWATGNQHIMSLATEATP